jgi:N,N'-diacetylchitobiose non-reducing end deacetylase
VNTKGDKKMPNDQRLEEMTGKTIITFCAHPDDDAYYCSGTLAKLMINNNNVIMVMYTNGNKGSHDLEMTSERLAQIRKKEEEEACAVIGIKSENIIWMGYDDGELEYANPKELCGKATRLIRMYRPDVVICFDPGREFRQWHKTDHSMAAFNTVDAARASAYHLYYPEHLLYEGLKPFMVKDFFFFSSREPNYEVDVTDAIELKLLAQSKHVSQQGSAHQKYSSTMTEVEQEELRKHIEEAKGKKHIERFRRGGTDY